MMQRYLLRDIALQTHNPTLERLVCSFEARGPGVPGCITYLDAHKKLCCLNQGRWEGLISVVTGIGSGPSSNDSGKTLQYIVNVSVLEETGVGFRTFSITPPSPLRRSTRHCCQEHPPGRPKDQQDEQRKGLPQDLIT